MDTNESIDWFDGVEMVISEPDKFKSKLKIGEDAYAILRMKNKVSETFLAVGSGGIASYAATSAVIAETFFANSLFWISLGAATPIGWVIGAGVVTAGTYVGLSRYVKEKTNKLTKVIPEFINTPLDILGIALFNYITPLALKLADADGNIDKSEKKIISTYFVNEWGYDPEFVARGITYTEEYLSKFSLEVLAQNLAKYKKANPDCNYSEMSKDTLKFLIEIMEADGKIDEREESLVTLVEGVFSEVGQSNIRKNAKAGIDKIKAGSANIYKKTFKSSKNEKTS